jgi:hypothetical protein
MSFSMPVQKRLIAADIVTATHSTSQAATPELVAG